MQTHIKILGWLYIILGALGILAAGFVVLLVAGGGLISGDRGDHDCLAGNWRVPGIGLGSRNCSRDWAAQLPALGAHFDAGPGDFKFAWLPNRHGAGCVHPLCAAG